MKDNNVLKPWSKLKVDGTKDNIKVYVDGRIYSFDNSLLFSSINNLGIEMLDREIEVKLKENNKPFIFNKVETFLLNHDDSHATIISTGKSERFIVSTLTDIDYDGFAKIKLTIVPVGHTVNQVFGVEKNNDRDFSLDNLCIEIPIKNEILRDYHFYPLYYKDQMPEFSKDKIDFSKVAMSRKIPSSMSFDFKPIIYIGNSDMGLSFEASSDKYWYPEKKKAIEIIKEDDYSSLRLNLLSHHPYDWDFHKENPNFLQAYGFMPLTYEFSLQATPVKINKDPIYKEKSVHIDCFKKIKEDYYEFLLEKSNNEKFKCNLDLIKDSGVTILYLHEKWNQIQNYFEIGEERTKEIKEIIKACHERNIKVIPYFGYEISTLSPIFNKYGLKYAQYVGGQYPNNGGWYRVPYQRCYIECLNSPFKDLMIEGFEKFFEEFDFDGIYLDSTIYPVPCVGEHGCGYRDTYGILHSTYPVFEIRDYVKEIYKIVKKHNGIVSIHTSNCINASAMTYADVIWDGEAIQTYLHENGIDSIPKDYLDAEFVNKQIGVNYEYLIYTFDNWTFKDGLSLSLPYGILPKPNDIDEPLSIMKNIWKIYDEFDVNNSEFIKGKNDLFMVDGDVLIGTYKKINEMLIVISNPSIKEISFKIRFKNNCVIENLINKKLIESSDYIDNIKGADIKLIKVMEIEK